MEDLAQWLETELGLVWPIVQNMAVSLTQPSRLVQFALLAICFVAAHFIARLLDPPLDRWMRSLENVPKSRLRMLVVFARRLRLILFIAIAWATAFVLRMVTWPSHSYLVTLAAMLTSAWLFVAIASRLIRNRILRVVVAWSAWIFVAISILGLKDQAVAVLDRSAITFGNFRLSLLLVVEAAVVLGVLLALSRLIVGVGANRIRRADDLSPSMQVLTDKVLRIAVYATAVLIGLSAIGVDLTNLAVISGAIGLGIGFGLQKVVSNLISGLILLLDKSIKPGDVISLGQTFGWISALGARYVSVVTRDGREYLIPNEDLITGQVVNWSHTSSLVRLDIEFGVSYRSDPHEVRRIARKAAAGVPRVVGEPAPVCHIVGFGDSSIDFLLRFWIVDPTQGITNVRGDVYLALWDAFRAAEIEIPYPRRDVSVVTVETAPARKTF